MAGLAPISLQQRCGIDGRPYPNARAYFYEAETLTPIDTYRDYSLGSAHPFPVQADAYGVFPAIFIDEAENFYRMRITTAQGVTLTDLVTLPVIGPTGGGGGAEVPVDPDALMATGDTIWTPKSGTRSGFVRMNGRTIGSASSGAAERANADTEALYVYAWTNFSNTLCPVTGGRGASGAADFAANKPIAVLDMRTRAPLGLADMGNSALTTLDFLTFGAGDATTGGSSGGASTHTLTTTETATHSHGVTDPGHVHTFTDSGSDAGFTRVGAAASSGFVAPGYGSAPGTLGIKSNTTGISINNAGSGGAHNNMSPFILGTWYWRL